MSEAIEWSLIGRGHIGHEIERQLGQDYVSERLAFSPKPRFIINSQGILESDGKTPAGFESLDDVENFPDVTFVALPTTDADEGIPAYDYISTILDRGKIAVTAEKGALANHFLPLKEKSDDFARLGINAAVGGGTRLLDVASEYTQDIDNITQIHLALNGTLSAIMSMVAPPEGSGMSLGQAVHQAVRLDYAEPGSDTPYAVIKTEAESDIPKKTAIFFNKLGLGEYLDWTDLKFSFNDEQIAQVIEEARIRRFIVSLYSNGYLAKAISCPEDGAIGGFNIDHDGWRIVGGFRQVDRNPLFSPLANLTGPGNGMVIGLGPDETDGHYTLTGPGAGVRPTVNTMIDDYLGKIS